MSKTGYGRYKLLLPMVVVASGAALVGGAGVAQATVTGQRSVIVHQNGGYVANMCIKNKSKNNIESCTGKVGKGSVRELDISYDGGDTIEFIVAVVAGHNSYYTLADRDHNCYATGTSLGPNSYCRVDT